LLRKRENKRASDKRKFTIIMKNLKGDFYRLEMNTKESHLKVMGARNMQLMQFLKPVIGRHLKP
jgi:hypothetical protein